MLWLLGLVSCLASCIADISFISPIILHDGTLPVHLKYGPPTFDHATELQKTSLDIHPSFELHPPNIVPQLEYGKPLNEEIPLSTSVQKKVLEDERTYETILLTPDLEYGPPKENEIQIQPNVDSLLSNEGASKQQVDLDIRLIHSQLPQLEYGPPQLKDFPTKSVQNRDLPNTPELGENKETESSAVISDDNFVPALEYGSPTAKVVSSPFLDRINVISDGQKKEVESVAPQLEYGPPVERLKEKVELDTPTVQYAELNQNLEIPQLEYGPPVILLQENAQSGSLAVQQPELNQIPEIPHLEYGTPLLHEPETNIDNLTDKNLETSSSQLGYDPPSLVESIEPKRIQPPPEIPHFPYEAQELPATPLQLPELILSNIPDTEKPEFLDKPQINTSSISTGIGNINPMQPNIPHPPALPQYTLSLQYQPFYHPKHSVQVPLYETTLILPNKNQEIPNKLNIQSIQKGTVSLPPLPTIPNLIYSEPEGALPPLTVPPPPSLPQLSYGEPQHSVTVTEVELPPHPSPLPPPPTLPKLTYNEPHPVILVETSLPPPPPPPPTLPKLSYNEPRPHFDIVAETPFPPLIPPPPPPTLPKLTYDSPVVDEVNTIVPSLPPYPPPELPELTYEIMAEEPQTIPPPPPPPLSPPPPSLPNLSYSNAQIDAK